MADDFIWVHIQRPVMSANVIFMQHWQSGPK
jgi:hypothetical protein